MTPYWRVNEVPLPRVACGMISSAVLVQLNGWQSVFQLSMNLVIAPMRSVTELNAPRRIACRVMMPKKISINRPWGLLSRGWARRVAVGESVELPCEAVNHSGMTCHFGVPTAGFGVPGDRGDVG